MSQRECQAKEVTIKVGPVFDPARCRELREELRQLIAAGETDLVFDLAETSVLSPSAIYLLLATRHTLEGVGSGRLALVNLNDDLRQLLVDLHLEARLGFSLS